MAWRAMAVRRARTRTRVLSHHNLCACAFGRVQCAGASANAAGPSADADGNTETDGEPQAARNGRATREARVGTPHGTTAPERTDRAGAGARTSAYTAGPSIPTTVRMRLATSRRASASGSMYASLHLSGCNLGE